MRRLTLITVALFAMVLLSRLTPQASANNITYRAANNVGNSKTVAEIQQPTITWNPPALITYGTALGAEQLNATADVAGTFSYTPAAGAVLHVGNAQTLEVTFTPDDTDAFTSVTKDVAIDVKKAPLTITIDDDNKRYGYTLPPFTATYTGFAPSDGPTSLDTPLVFTSAATAGSNVGTYAIGGSADDNDYTITIVNGTLTVTPAPLTISANDTFKYVGTANPTLTASYFGLVNGDTRASLDTPVTLETTATKDSAVGSYPITASGAADPNYTITFVDGTLSVIDKLVPTIDWSNPAAITYSTPLGADQLNATANVPGTFSYTPADGALLHVGNAQTLEVTFTPDNTDIYATVTKNVTIDVKKAPLTVTINNASKVYGDPLPPFNATYTGFVAGDDATSLDTPLVFTSAATAGSDVGNYAITGSADDNDYTITIVNGTLTVTPAPLTISANINGKVVGTANPPLTASYSGLVNGDTESSLDTPVKLETTATKDSPVGTYPITASGAADPNYTITFVDGTFSVVDKLIPYIIWSNPAAITYGTPLGAEQLNATATNVFFSIPGTFTYTPAAGTILHVGNAQTLEVTFTPDDTDIYVSVTKDVTIDVKKAQLTVTIADASKVYGQALPLFNAAYSGFVAGDDATSLDAPLVFTSAATAGSDVGNYAITGSADDNDYTITIVNGTLTVTPAPLTISAEDKIRKIGTNNPELTATYSGFVNGDNEFILDKPVKLLTTATKNSPVGMYTISASDAADLNYTITFVNGTLTVTDKDIPTIVWNNPTAITYGTALGSGQLNAIAKKGTASVPGTFTYTPPAGVVLHAGNAQTLKVTFRPEDTDTYASVTKDVAIDVKKAELTITADNKSMPTGGPLPTLTVSYSGFVNSDTAAVLDTPAQLTTTATASSPLGNYPIVVSKAADADYAITFVQGTLTVKAKTATTFLVFLPSVRK